MSTSLENVLPASSGVTLPALVAAAGERASWRFLEFFTVNIRNLNTRAAYGRRRAISIASRGHAPASRDKPDYHAQSARIN
jgi:hypothetical protein